MSRHIEGASRLDKGDELYRRDMRSSKILLSRNGGVLYAFLIRDNRICRVMREEKEEFPIGTVVLGKVLNVAKEFRGAFFALKEQKGTKERTGFLQLKENIRYLPVNREADGRILCGDEIPVQVVKQAKGNKPPQLSTEYSLAGQFAVVSKGSGQIYYPAKLGGAERDRLAEAFKEWRGELIAGGSEEASLFEGRDIIFRTNASAVSAKVWRNEIVDLVSQIKNIDQISQTRTAYSILHRPEEFYLELIKDQPLSSLEEIVTDERDVFEVLSGHPFTRNISVRFYEDARISLQSVYALDTKLRELLSPKVYMKSGAYLMIEPTEALTAVDVNSGQAERKAEPEDFYFQINLEAVKEVCYQLSARNLSGMILVDFINMKDRRHTEELIRALKEETARDSVTTRFIDLTRLGLAEITRKKTSRTLRYVLRDWAWKKL